MRNSSRLMGARALLVITSSIGALLAVPALAQDEGDADHPDHERDIAGDEIVVTASPLARSLDETIIGTSVVSKEELARNLRNTVAETIAREPGVSTTFFGQGASRPVIRGLGGDRIRVLDSGIGAIDASATSPDHAVAIDPAAADRVEIVRGTSMLLFGSSASGGVVNVFSGRIPTAAPEGGVDGSITWGRSTADDGLEASGEFDVSLFEFAGGEIVFHGDGFHREGDDYAIPGFAESARLRAAEAEEADADDEEGEEEAFGVVPNSWFETTGGSAGVSWVGGRGHFGVSATMIDSQYGIPGGHGHEEDEEEEAEMEGAEEGGVFIDLKQRRIDVSGEREFDGWFEKAIFRLGYADYEHSEIEPSGDVGTVFANQGWEGRFELVDREREALGGTLRGAQGVQYRARDFSAIGEEAFTPPAESTQFGVFALREYEKGPLRAEIGGRFEQTTHEVVETGFRREFDGFSVSGGLGYKPMESLFFGVTAFRTERAPSTEELFSDGPHLATNAFEIGDPNLGEEVARGVEGTVRYSTDRFRISVNGFYTSYKDFIFEDADGTEEDGLPVLRFQAADATFQGFEAEVDAELFHAGAFDFHGDVGVDYVRATLDRPGDEDLPRIPPLSGVLGLEARSPAADLRFELEAVAAQNDVAAFELPTDGYELLNVYATLRPFGVDGPFLVRLSATNLTDEEARIHPSFLKDVAPLVGRNFRVALTGAF